MGAVTDLYRQKIWQGHSKRTIELANQAYDIHAGFDISGLIRDNCTVYGFGSAAECGLIIDKLTAARKKVKKCDSYTDVAHKVAVLEVIASAINIRLNYID